MSCAQNEVMSSIERRDEKRIVSLHKFIGNNGFAQYMYFNISTSHLSDHIVSGILVYLEYEHSFIPNNKI